MDLRRFYILHLVAGCLLFSWIMPPTRALWDGIDLRCFQFLNAFVQTSPTWQKFWALANYKSSEIIMDGIRLAFFLIIFMTSRPGQRRENIAKMVCTCLVILFGIFIISKGLFAHHIQVGRHGPTASIEGAFRLSSVVDWIYVKDHSLDSFPSDHGITACLFVISMFSLFGARYGLFALLHEGFYVLPRMVTGAHWLSDILVGSASVSLIIAAWIYATPLKKFLVYHLQLRYKV